MVRILTRCSSGRYVPLCNISSLSSIDRFSSIVFPLTYYRTYNLIMEWSYDDVVCWAILNLKVDQSIIARLRGKCRSIRRLICCIETDVAYEAYVYLHHSALFSGTRFTPIESLPQKSLTGGPSRIRRRNHKIEWIIHGFTLRRELMPPDRSEHFTPAFD
jgi:hypothetical protein